MDWMRREYWTIILGGLDGEGWAHFGIDLNAVEYSPTGGNLFGI